MSWKCDAASLRVRDDICCSRCLLNVYWIKQPPVVRDRTVNRDMPREFRLVTFSFSVVYCVELTRCIILVSDIKYCAVRDSGAGSKLGLVWRTFASLPLSFSLSPSSTNYCPSVLDTVGWVI